MNEIVRLIKSALECRPATVGLGVLFSTIASFFGGWDMGLSTLVILMGIDYLTGLMVALVFKKSKKTESGGFESNTGWKGLCKKGMTLLVVLIACRLDMLMGTTFIRDAAIICYITNEVLSIIENAGLMGVPIPKAIIDAIDVLKKKSDQQQKEEEPEEEEPEEEPEEQEEEVKEDEERD